MQALNMWSKLVNEKGKGAAYFYLFNFNEINLLETGCCVAFTLIYIRIS